MAGLYNTGHKVVDIIEGRGSGRILHNVVTPSPGLGERGGTRDKITSGSAELS